MTHHEDWKPILLVSKYLNKHHREYPNRHQQKDRDDAAKILKRKMSKSNTMDKKISNDQED